MLLKNVVGMNSLIRCLLYYLISVLFSQDAVLILDDGMIYEIILNLYQNKN